MGLTLTLREYKFKSALAVLAGTNLSVRADERQIAGAGREVMVEGMGLTVSKTRPMTFLLPTAENATDMTTYGAFRKIFGKTGAESYE